DVRGDAAERGTGGRAAAVRPQTGARIRDPGAPAAPRVPRGGRGRPPRLAGTRHHPTDADRGPRRLRYPNHSYPMANVGRGREPGPAAEPAAPRTAPARVCC